VHDVHGRYGYWRYIFQYRDADFISLDMSNVGPVVNRETSNNYLAGKTGKGKCQNAENGVEVFEEIWIDFKTENSKTISN